MPFKHYHADGTLCYIEIRSVMIMKDILLEYNPKLIIELGTYLGGFVRYILDWRGTITNDEMFRPKIYTWDFVNLLSEANRKLFRERGVTIVTEDLFDNSILLKYLLSLPVPKFLFIDNGHKEDELNLYSACLNPGDLMAVHDVGTEVILDRVKDPLAQFDEHPVSVEKLRHTKNDGGCYTRAYIRKKWSGKSKPPVVI